MSSNDFGCNSKSDIAVKFENVTKTYKLFKNDKERFFSIFWGKKKRGSVTTVNANNNLSFEIKRGEAVAFLGHNGA